MITEVAFISHKAGVTLQYLDEDNGNILLVTYGKIGNKYALTNVAGPWSGVDTHGGEDPKDWRAVILPGWEEEKRFLNDQAIVFLHVLNANYGGGVEVAASMWGGQKYIMDN
jgi:hypothetical protein